MDVLKLLKSKEATCFWRNSVPGEKMNVILEFSRSSNTITSAIHHTLLFSLLKSLLQILVFPVPLFQVTADLLSVLCRQMLGSLAYPLCQVFCFLRHFVASVSYCCVHLSIEAKICILYFVSLTSNCLILHSWC